MIFMAEQLFYLIVLLTHPGMNKIAPKLSQSTRENDLDVGLGRKTMPLRRNGILSLDMLLLRFFQ
jgi:hypothetical protein